MGEGDRQIGRKASVWIRSTYGAIERTPHLLQLEFFNALLVWRDGRTLDASIVLENHLGRLDHLLDLWSGNAGVEDTQGFKGVWHSMRSREPVVLM